MTRFFTGYDWRWAVFDIEAPDGGTAVLKGATFLDRIFSSWGHDRVLCDPCVSTVTVPSGSPLVNLLYDDVGTSFDDEPMLAEGRRALLGFRREAQGSAPPWVCRASGIVMNVKDSASNSDGSGRGLTTATAYDVWQLLYKRPVLKADLAVPTPSRPCRFVAIAPDQIILQLLNRTAFVHGTILCDVSSGTLESLPPVSIDFEAGVSVGEAIKRLCDLDYCDIVFDPIYQADAISRLNVYARAGVPRYDLPFSWDAAGRSLASIDREEDGNQRATDVQYTNDQGIYAPMQTSWIDRAKYGVYYLTASYKALFQADLVKRAKADLAARRNGVTSITVTPMPERSPVPLLAYDIGDTVPIYAHPAGLRKKLDGTWRVTRIPLRGDTSQVETVDALEVMEEVPS